jgi:predicted membrane protein
MANTQSDHWGYRLGRAAVRAFGQMRMWVKYLALVMRRKGVPDGLVLVLAWAATILVFGIALYVLFWLTVFVLMIVCAVLVMANFKPVDSEDWILKEEEDHRDGPFYDPINFSDDPDPRFDDHHRR